MESRLTHMNTITMEKVAIAKSCVRIFRLVIMFIAISSTTTGRTLPCMVEAFGSGSKSPFTTRPTQISKAASSVTLFMGMSRKARRQMQQEQKTKVGRDKKFRDALEDNDDKTTSKATPTTASDDENLQTTKNQVEEEINRRMDQRPDVSNLYVDPETGMEIIQQGRYVMNVITRKAISLHPNPDMQLAQMFPGVPMEVRAQHRYNWVSVEVPEMIASLRDACSLANDGTLPPAPSVTNRGIDFVLANRDRLGHKMSKTLGKLMMRAAWQEDKETMIMYRNLLRNFLTIENYISAPFRQIIMDAELAIGPNFGNLDLSTFVGTRLYERAAAYIVLKGMQCTWEKKVRDAEVIENTPQTTENFYKVLATGDPRRYHPEPDVIWELKDCARVCAMCLEMVKTFVNDEKMFSDLPVELRFLEAALTIQGGVALRRFITEEFCPREEITPEALREGMRRLLQQLDNMYLDPYADIRNVVDKLQRAMSVGTEDERNPYEPYLASLSVDSPAYFQTYTFNHHPMSLVRFLDAKKFEPISQKVPLAEVENPFTSLFESLVGTSKPKNQGRVFLPADAEKSVYVPPVERAAGRPHNLGWLQYLDEMEDAEDGVFGQSKPGEIIMD